MNLIRYIIGVLQIPRHWPDGMSKPGGWMTPYIYFMEMSPLFCTMDVPMDGIGNHMDSFMTEHQMSRVSVLFIAIIINIVITSIIIIIIIIIAHISYINIINIIITVCEMSA